MKMTEEVKQKYMSRLLFILFDHVGASNKIGMGELYEKVFEKSWNHRINDTKPLRVLITELRRKGIQICSDDSSSGGGYYIASAASELNEYCKKKLHDPALRKLSMEAKMRKIALPVLLGQMALEYEK